jgi:hypothetical protein
MVDTLRIDRVLGSGAFGITYLVTDTLLGTPFALKEYLPRDLVRRLPDACSRHRAGPALPPRGPPMQSLRPVSSTSWPRAGPSRNCFITTSSRCTAASRPTARPTC